MIEWFKTHLNEPLPTWRFYLNVVIAVLITNIIRSALG